MVSQATGVESDLVVGIQLALGLDKIVNVG
jgi:hypothetical protein